MQRDRPVTRGFRDRVLTLYPMLAKNAAWFGFFEYLCFNDFYDVGNSEAQVIPAAFVKLAIGLQLHTRDFDRFDVGAFLEDFRRHVLPEMALGTYEIAETCRTVIRTGMSAEMLQVLHQELVTFPGTPFEKVRLISGARFEEHSRKALRQVDEEDALATLGLAPCEGSTTVIEYLNGLPAKTFTQKVNENIATALEVAIDLDATQSNRRNTVLIHWLSSQAQPFFGPSKKMRTVRVFAVGQTIMSLSSPVRYALIHGWHTFDLRCAHLAIVARDWQLPRLADWLLEEANNVWSELCSLFPEVPEGSSKPAIKVAVYAFVYGGSKRSIVASLAETIGMDERTVRARLFRHWIVSDVYTARNVVLQRVLNDRGATDCFGRWLPCMSKHEARSLLSQLAQAVELQLLLPVIAFAKTNRRDVTVTLWEHDGFTVAIRQRPEVWIGRICKLIDDECSRRNVPTRLELKSKLA